LNASLSVGIRARALISEEFVSTIPILIIKADKRTRIIMKLD
jgi:hypothetical protein